jgi:hypothetical protein
MSTKLANYVNEMIENVNKLIEGNEDLIAHYNDTLKALEDLRKDIEMMKEGFYIKDGTIEWVKFSENCKDKIREFVIETIGQIAKFVWFGIDDNGYFYAVIPRAWEDIVFSTDVEGHLILEY